MATCSCGRDTFKGGWAEPGRYCPSCGDSKLPGGGVESRTELAKDTARLDKLAYVDIQSEHGIRKPRHVWIAVSIRTGKEVARVPVQRSYRRTMRALADAIPDPEEVETDAK